MLFGEGGKGRGGGTFYTNLPTKNGQPASEKTQKALSSPFPFEMTTLRLRHRRRSQSLGREMAGGLMLAMCAGGADIDAVDLRTVQLLKDPTRMAHLLVRVCSPSLVDGASTPASDRSSTEHNNGRIHADGEAEEEEGDEEEGVHAEAETMDDAGGEEDEDDAERLEEENEDDDANEAQEEADAIADNQVVYIKTGESDGRSPERAGLEDDLEAMTTALDIATKIVDELKLKLLVQAGQQMESQGDSAATAIGKPNTTNTISNSNSKVGVPRVRAQQAGNSHCMSCTKSFNAFHRRGNCTRSLEVFAICCACASLLCAGVCLTSTFCFCLCVDR